MKQRKVWHTSFFEDVNPNHKKWASRLKKYIYDFDGKTKQSRLGRSTKRNLSEPPFDFFDFALAECEEFERWHRWLDARMRSFVKKANEGCLAADLKWKIHYHESWYHITKNGGFHGPHIHSNTSWGWIYYFNDIDVKKDGGSNKFYNPTSQNVTYVDLGLVHMISVDSEIFEVEPRAGKLVAFPGWLLHEAQPYFGKEDRIILSGNTQVLAEA